MDKIEKNEKAEKVEKVAKNNTRKKRSFGEKVGSAISRFFAAIWRGICAFFAAIINAIYSLFEKIIALIRGIFELILGLIEAVLLGSAALVGASALLVFAVCMGVYFVGKTVGLSGSESFVEMREAFLTTKNFKIEKKLKADFEESQLKLPVSDRFDGELPVMFEPKDENEENKERREKLS